MSYAIPTLKALALKGAAADYLAVSTRALGTELGVSQQTASNRLIALEASGLISRRRGVHGQDILISREGMEALKRELADYQRIFARPGSLTVTGTVTGGLGEGQYYLNKTGYSAQITDKLGFEAFRGTLNLRVQEAEIAKLSLVPPESRIKIESFRDEGRTYGGAECIKATLQDTPGAIIMPTRTHHTGILEIISPVNLRSALGLKDGDRVEIVLGE